MDNKYKVKVLMLKGEKGYKGDVGPQGPKGDKGDPLTFDNLTDSQKQELMTNLSTYMKKEEGSLSVEAGNTMIQTNITTYNDWSMLFVFANGVALSKDEYEIQLTNDKYNIVLKTSPKENMTIDYVCYNLIEFAKEDYDKLPKGPKGDKGDKGDTGQQGPAGSIDNIVVGGRNLLLGSDIKQDGEGSKATSGVNIEVLNRHLGDTVTISFSYTAKNWTGRRFGAETCLTFEDGYKQYIGTWVNESANGNATEHSTVVLLNNHGEIKSADSIVIYVQETTSGTVTAFNPKLEIGTIPTDWTPAPEDIENEVTMVNTKVENKLSNCDKLLDTNYSTTGAITFTEEKTYNFYTIIIRGDDYNGIALTIPKDLMDSNEVVPFVLDARDPIHNGYSVKTQGTINHKSINVRGVTLTGWTQVRLIVYGVY